MVLQKFGRLLSQDTIFRGERPVFWSVQNQRILAEDEMEPKSEMKDCAIMKLPVKRFAKKSHSIKEMYPDIKLLVFCSEPWQIAGMNAAGVNEGISYVLAKWNDEYIIAAEKRLPELQMRLGIKYKKLMAFTGDTLEDMVLSHPLNERDVSILINNEVTSEFGSGINCISPAHDINSLRVSYHYKLSKEGFVDKDGLLTEDTGPLYAGLSVLDPKTNETILKLLDEDGFLFTSYKYKNDFFECTGTGEKVILRSNKSWFMKVPELLKMQCFDEISTVRFSPKLNLKDSEEAHTDFEKMKNKEAKQEDLGAYYINILEELNDFDDWCISDVNLWGIPIPAFKHADTEELLINQVIVDHFAKLVQKYGTSDIWYTFDAVDLLPKQYHAEAHKLQKQFDVFDSWFDSSLSWNFALNMRPKYVESPDQMLLEEGKGRGRKVGRSNRAKSVMAYGEHGEKPGLVKDDAPLFPANLVCEGYDQHPRWFLCSLLTSMVLENKAPYLALKTHGMVLDQTNQKMSKSFPEQVIDPEDLIKGTVKLDGSRSHGYGADAMRLWAAMNDGDTNLQLDHAQLERANENLKEIRHLLKMILGFLKGFDKEAHRVSFRELSPVDQMAFVYLNQFLKLQQQTMD